MSENGVGAPGKSETPGEATPQIQPPRSVQPRPTAARSEAHKAGGSERRRPRQRPSVFWALALIGVGAVLLLWNLGYLPQMSWPVLLRLSPLLLVALGIDLLIGRRSTAGAFLSAILIIALIGGALYLAFSADNIPALSKWTASAEYQREHIEHPLAGTERATVYIDWSSLPGQLGALRDSRNLIEGDISYRGDLRFDVDEHGNRADIHLSTRFTTVRFGLTDLLAHEDDRWDLALSPEVLLDLTLDSGSGPVSFDLTDLQVTDLVIDSGSGPVTLTLPAETTMSVRIDGGSGPINIDLPDDVGARLVLDSGSGPLAAGSRLRLVRGESRGDGVWETDDLETAEHTISLDIDQGSGPVTFR